MLDEAEAARWTRLLEVRDVVLKALEDARVSGRPLPPPCANPEGGGGDVTSS